jgi:transmembrane sensor
MPDTPPNAENSADLETAASAWLARRDRGLTSREQDEYLEWLRANPRHGAMIAHLDKTWSALNALAEWRPAHSPQPNPDLLAAPRTAVQRARWARVTQLPLAVRLVAAAAVVAGGLFVVQTVWWGNSAPAGTVRVILPPERLTLTDGSTVELNHGGKIETDFSPEIRRVRLVRGEAHFTVSKNPARPFIVEANGVSVRAVGTAFDVRHASGAVEVLVTEGKVQVERAAPNGTSPAVVPVAVAAPTPLVAGERAIVDTTASAARPVVAAVSAGEMAQALSWQGVRLEFEELPLAEVVAEFNLRNRRQLVIGDAATGRLRVGGNFRADNVDAFVRLLDASFGVTAERRSDGSLVLRRAK